MAKRRPSGDGMVRRRGDGRWEGRIVVGHKENGGSIFRYVSAKTQKALMKKLHRSIEEYRDVDLSENSRMPLADWLDRWLEEYASPSVRESTLRGYRQYIDSYIKPRLGDKQVCKITSADVQALYRELRRNGRRKRSYSQWIFPNPVQPEMPVNPSTAYFRLKALLKNAGLPAIRFHDVRHTFATMSLENGMDVKTLSAIIGHVASTTTLNIYTHITGEMQRNAARSIDRGIAGVEVREDGPEREESAPAVEFTPCKPPRRRPGTGCVSRINDHLWEGRYSPKWIDGRKHARNIYAHTREECEEKLSALIVEMKRELGELKAEHAAGTAFRH